MRSRSHITLQSREFSRAGREAMGVTQPDLFKQVIQDIDRILAEVAAHAAVAETGPGKRPRSAPRQYAGGTTSSHRVSRQAPEPKLAPVRFIAE